MNSPVKLTLLLTGIFVAGLVTGGFATKCYLRKEFAKRVAPELWCSDRVALLAKRLDLTAEQQEKLRPIVQRDRDELIRTRDTTVAETRRIIGRMERDIAAILTPEQQVKFEKFNQERRKNLKRFFGGFFSGKEQGKKAATPEPPKGD